MPKNLTTFETEQVNNLIYDIEETFGGNPDCTGFVNEYSDDVVYLTFEFEDGGEDHNVNLNRKTMEIIKE